MCILLVNLQAEWRMERPQAEAFEIVTQLLDARLVTDRRMRVGCAGVRLCRIFSALAMHVVQPLGPQIILFKVVVRNGPGRRYSVNMADLAEVFLAQAKKRSSVKLRVAANIIVGVRMKAFAGLVSPLFLGLIFSFDVYRPRFPIGFLAAYIVAALDHEDVLAAGGQGIGEGAAARSGSNDDDVVVFALEHGYRYSFWIAQLVPWPRVLPNDLAARLSGS